jgi:hypothetical protein
MKKNNHKSIANHAEKHTQDTNADKDAVGNNFETLNFSYLDWGFKISNRA